MNTTNAFSPPIIGGLPFAYPGPGGCLAYYDEPLLFIATDEHGQAWLIESIASDAEAGTTTSMAFALTPEEAIAWSAPEVDEIAMLPAMCAGIGRANV